MPFFKVRGESRIIITNFKVMFTSFKATGNLQKLKRYRAYFYLKLTSPDIYFTVRDPYAKAVSFYKDKFQKIPSQVDSSQYFKWEKPQRVFFPLLGLDSRTSSTAEIKQGLLDTSFDEYVDMLAKVYHLDEHINPQSWILNHPNYGAFKSLGVSLAEVQILHIENLEHMQRLSSVTNFDVNQKANSTSTVKQQYQINAKQRVILNQIYAEDFTNFGYETIN
ncbi:sulfotransferase family 2 domain-containing protein [Paraglaciecola sp. 2405UD69-4]|uniref:sulfotransferase family 2 domain-containing protein n=1 Tax=Paraglaciecola sp. 2405UD69-4 TaxID=3391836 RepID=UPI0039C9B8B5